MQNRFGDELGSEDDVGPVEDEIAPISQDENAGQEPDLGALSAPPSARLRVRRWCGGVPVPKRSRTPRKQYGGYPSNHKYSHASHQTLVYQPKGRR